MPLHWKSRPGFNPLLMYASIGGGGKVVSSFEGFVEAALFFIAAVEGNRLYGIFRFQQASRGTLDPLPDDIGVDGRLYQAVKPGL